MCVCVCVRVYSRVSVYVRMCSHVSVSVRVCSRVCVCSNFVPFHRHDFVKLFHILLSRCTNFVSFHFFSVSPPSLCQFHLFLRFTCHNFVKFVIFYSHGAPTLYHFTTFFHRFTAITLSILRVFSVYTP